MEQELIDFGLTSNEAKIYLVLLEKGPLNPYQIAEKTGFHRGYIYDALERMQEKGVVSTIHLDGKKNYQATAPEVLGQATQQKAAEFQKIIPTLNRLKHAAREDMKVEVYKGKHVFRVTMNDQIACMKPARDLLAVSSDEKVFEETDPIYFRRYLKKEKEMKCREKVIIKQGGYRLPWSQIEYRELPAEYIGNGSQFMYADRVCFLLWGNPNHLIVIRNQQVAETYRKQFYVLWELAKKIRKV